MSAAISDLGREIARRRTFAIVSHPDATLKDSPRHIASKMREIPLKNSHFLIFAATSKVIERHPETHVLCTHLCT